MNETAVFSCTAHIQCTSQTCTLNGQWIINNNFLDGDHGQNELTLYWRMNNSEYCINSEVCCHFYYFHVAKDSNTVILKWIDGELLGMYMHH